MGKEAERLRERLRSSSVHSSLMGGLGRHQCVFSGGGSLRSMMDTASPATIHPGEHGIVTAMTWGGYGWKESIGGGLG